MRDRSQCAHGRHCETISNQFQAVLQEESSECSKTFLKDFLRHEELEEDCWWHVACLVNNFPSRRQAPDGTQHNQWMINSACNEMKFLNHSDAQTSDKWTESNLEKSVKHVCRMSVHSICFFN